MPVENKQDPVVIRYHEALRAYEGAHRDGDGKGIAKAQYELEEARKAHESHLTVMRASLNANKPIPVPKPAQEERSAEEYAKLIRSTLRKAYAAECEHYRALVTETDACRNRKKLMREALKRAGGATE